MPLKNRFFPATAIVFLGLLISGCAALVLGLPSPSIQTSETLLRAGIRPLKVGNFLVSPSAPVGIDESIAIRTAIVKSPIRNSFSAYLERVLTTELNAAGKLSEDSNLVVTGELVNNRLDAGISSGQGEIAVRFMLMRGGTILFDQTLTESATWDSHFVGIEAASAAVNQYSQLYRAIISKLFQNEAFVRAALR